MNTNPSPISGLRKTYINYLFYENVFLITTLNTRSNSHMVSVQYTFTYTKIFYIKSHFHSSWLTINVQSPTTFSEKKEKKKSPASLISWEQLLDLYRETYIKLTTKYVNIIFLLYINLGLLTFIILTIFKHYLK